MMFGDTIHEIAVAWHQIWHENGDIMIVVFWLLNRDVVFKIQSNNMHLKLDMYTRK